QPLSDTAAASPARMPSKASAAEPRHTTSARAAMPVRTVAEEEAEAIVAAAAIAAAAVAAIMAGDMRRSVHVRRFPLTILILLLFVAPSAASTDFFKQTTFASADEGMQAFLDAITLNDPLVLQTLLGPKGPELFDSGDAAADTQWRKQFLDAY